MKSLCSLLSLGTALALALLSPMSASAAAGDEHWSQEFGWPGSTNIVSAIAVNQGRVYAGGFNTLFTNTTLMVWDGLQWSTIGKFAGGNVTLYDMAFVGNTLYVAGVFTNVDGIAIKGLARRNGSTWASVGFNGFAYSLAVSNTDLYVGGTFTNAGNVAATNIARWDGSAWHALGNGLGRSNDFILALAIGNGFVYAGGRYTNSGSQAVSNLASWNGSTWTSIGGGVNDRVNGLALNGTDLYTSGWFSMAGPTAASGIARWDGTNWFSLGTGIGGGTPTSVAVFSNLVCVGGGFNSAGGIPATNFAVWNGSTWSPGSGGLSAVAYRVLSTATNVYVGGNFLVAGVGLMNEIASWDGTQWAPIGAPGRIAGLQTSVRSVANDGTNLYAGGSFLYAGQTNAIRIGRYDGTNWHAFGTGLNNNVNAIAVAGTNVYAGGDFTGGSGGPLAFHMARWDGSQWVSLNNASFTKVTTLATRTNDLFIAGYFGVTAANGTASWLTRWDGANFWSLVAFASNTFNVFYLDTIGFTGMAVTDTNIYLSGHTSMSECDDTLTICTNCDNVMRFDGTYCRVMGTGLSSNAVAIAAAGTNVYFAGAITNAGGVLVHGIACWNGTAWSDVGGGIVGPGRISALAVIGTNLYAGGTFTNVGGVPARCLARWDGNSWFALGRGTAFASGTGSVLALTTIGSDLYVGGIFDTVGGRDSRFVARWNEGLNFDGAALRLSQPAGGQNAPFSFALSAIGVPVYVIEGSTNLTVWSPLLTNSVTPYDFVDSNAPAFLRRFYRARSLP